MSIVTESRHPGEHIVSEANGSRSREQGVLASGNSLPAGAVLGIVGGEYVALDQDAETGAEDASAILYAAVDATSADAACVVHVRDCEVDGAALTWPSDIEAGEKTAAIAALSALGIIVR